MVDVDGSQDKTPLHLLVRQPSLSLADAHILSISVYVCVCRCVYVSLCNDSSNIKGAAFKSALYTRSTAAQQQHHDAGRRSVTRNCWNAPLSL